MDLDLTYEQRAQLELIALYCNKSAEQVLLDTAQFLMNCEANYYEPPRALPTQQFLPDDQLETRLAQILNHER